MRKKILNTISSFIVSVRSQTDYDLDTNSIEHQYRSKLLKKLTFEMSKILELYMNLIQRWQTIMWENNEITINSTPHINVNGPFANDIHTNSYSPNYSLYV